MPKVWKIFRHRHELPGFGDKVTIRGTVQPGLFLLPFDTVEDVEPGKCQVINIPVHHNIAIKRLVISKECRPFFAVLAFSGTYLEGSLGSTPTPAEFFREGNVYSFAKDIVPVGGSLTINAYNRSGTKRLPFRGAFECKVIR